MSRRRRAVKREILPDAKFGDIVITRFMNALMPSGSARRRRSQDPPGKKMEPGATLFTRMFKGASSRASDLATLISAAFTAL